MYPLKFPAERRALCTMGVLWVAREIKHQSSSSSESLGGRTAAAFIISVVSFRSRVMIVGPANGG